MRRLTLLYIFFAFCCVNIQAAVTFPEAKKLAVAHDYEKALPAFQTLMRQPSFVKNAECNKFYGQCLCMTGKYSESLKYLEIGAKGGFYGAWWYLGISLQHLYDFEGAIDALQKYRAKCSATSGWIERTDSIIAECELGLRGVRHVQDVTIIDSLMVSQENFFQHYNLGYESGKILSDGVFENHSGDYRLKSVKNTSGGCEIFASSFIDNEWSVLERIPSLGSENFRVLYPFMRSDATTLYFACDSVPGYGGLDIYKTSYDSQSGEYYTPVRLGMPFNSPYNDYLLAIDETNQVGWWATDRNASPGMVCIYIFIFSEEPDYLQGENVSRARIDNIAETWGGENFEELRRIVHSPIEKPKEYVRDISIPIREGKVYTSVDQFRNPKAREAYLKYIHTKEEYESAINDLKALRMEYAKASASDKERMKPQILQKEARLNTLRVRVNEEKKSFRNLEKF